MKIIGAGLSGLLAGCLAPQAGIIEASARRDGAAHKAVLRFRTPDVGNALGIEFRPVTVHKAIWCDGFQAPNPRLANQYSKKVIGRLADRSIWNLAPAERYIAPENLYEMMLARCESRIQWDTPITAMTEGKRDEPVISTMPMCTMVRVLGLKVTPEFRYAPIHVLRFRIKGADVFQTIYFADPATGVYRASITGDLLIIEGTNAMAAPEIREVLRAFGLASDDVTQLDETKQHYGKIAPLPDIWRRNFIHELTRRCGVYSLGRFAVWRNILLDDVLKDFYVIRKLWNADDYGHQIRK